MKHKLTAIIPTLNEENNIEGAIKSLDFADEIIVIDSFSSDRTVEISKRLGVKVLLREFDDFSSQKNFAIEKSTYDWVFVLDADERINTSLSEEIKGKLSLAEDLVGYFVYRNFFYENRRISFGGWQTDKVLRLFRKDACRYDGKPVHEKIEYDGEVGYLLNKLDHFSFRNYDQYWSKLKFYALLQAKELYNSKKKISLLHFTIKPAFRFIVLFLVRGGIFDGYKGFILAKLHASGVRQRYVKFSSIKKKNG